MLTGRKLTTPSLLEKGGKNKLATTSVHGASRASTPPTRTNLHRVTAATAAGKRPVPFRTRKLSLPAPMILPLRVEK